MPSMLPRYLKKRMVVAMLTFVDTKTDEIISSDLCRSEVSRQVEQTVPVSRRANLLHNVHLKHIGTANPPYRFSQQEVAKRLGVVDPTFTRFFAHDHIQYRHLYLPKNSDTTGSIEKESFLQLNQRFLDGAVEMTSSALQMCLEEANLGVDDIDYICCVTSTGFVVPTLSALFIKKFNLRVDCQRVDIVGMGCNAGLNGLNTVSHWAAANPGRNALLICVEVCSAMYVADATTRTAVVNSLFADGAAVALVKSDARLDGDPVCDTKILGFESHLIPDHIDDLRFDWDEIQGRYSFYVGRNTPHAIAAVCDQPLERLLDRFGLRREQIKHWVLHGGGSTVVNGIQKKFSLTDMELRHTREVLRDFGNLSSASFLFSLQKMLATDDTKPGDFGLFMTMGPGLTIEMALVQWAEYSS
jgi:3,5-dihydroxyphenylacetyl-CoA synthase